VPSANLTTTPAVPSASDILSAITETLTFLSLAKLCSNEFVTIGIQAKQG
jgi:hypothetical protein